jgi:uncharacterized protein YbaR (Trm112 family)
VDPLVVAVATAIGGCAGNIRGSQTSMDAEEARRKPVGAEQTKPISDDLLEILACPLCKTAVQLERNKLICTSCGRRYRIEDGIPIMLIDEAELPKQ